MKSVKLLLAAVVALLVGCETMSTTTDNGVPVLLLDTQQLRVNGGGGEIPIFYAVQNGVPGLRPTAKCGAEWISVKEITKDTIMLIVEESNLDEERLGFVTVSYEGIEKSLRVTVLQNKQLLNKFSLEALDVTQNSCSIRYAPKVAGVQYMANIIDSEYFKQSGITDMSLFIETEMESYRTLANQNGHTLQSLMMEAISPQLIYTEEVVRSFNKMRPGATYVAYAYGVEFDGDDYTVTVPLHQISVQLPMSQMYDVTFNISAQIASSGVASVAISPVNWKNYYAVNIIPDTSLYYVQDGENMSENTLRALGNDFYKRARQAMQGGITAEAFLRSSCYVGSQMINMSVNGGTKYMVVVFAVESEDGGIPTMCSMPTLAYL